METRYARTTIGTLRRLKTTIACNFGGMYHEDKDLCQVIVNTTKMESELESWLCKQKANGYIGISETENHECDYNVEMDSYDWDNAIGKRGRR
jgi:hypothetical protein